MDLREQTVKSRYCVQLIYAKTIQLVLTVQKALIAIVNVS
jgi:hypothetical protein